MKRYLRALLEELPHAAAEGYHVFGWRGVYLAMSAFLFRRQWFPVSLPQFGVVRSISEATNVLDNFALGELRSAAVEDHLRNSTDALVVDVGVNVGVTCRWWLGLSPSVRVIGIDMFQEALDFTTGRMSGPGQLARWHPICAAVSDHDGEIEVRFDDPLLGTSRMDASGGRLTRVIPTRTMDQLVAPFAPGRIALLKVDIEGAAGRALMGARQTLRRCDYVVVETHSEDETRVSSSALIDAGLCLFRSRGRTAWWGRN